jgi:hypothetical protein
MKLLTFFFFTLISINCLGQSVELTNSKLPIFQGVVQLNGKDSNQIYVLLKEWIAKNYKSAKEVIQFDDPENGKLILKGIDKYFIAGPMGIKAENISYHTITLESKPEKFRFTVEITEVTSGTLEQPLLHEILLSDPPLKSNGKPYTGGMLNAILKQKEQHLDHLHLFNSGLIESLKTIGLEKIEDW